MIYVLQALHPLPLSNIFAGLPPHALGLFVWVLSLVLAMAYVVRAKEFSVSSYLGIPTPLLLASMIYTGLFINLYHVIDEVSINLEHPYNLFHYGRFSMSPAQWVDGTVECIYYLLHTPFAWSQHSLIISNYIISYLVGLLHLPLIFRIFGPKVNCATRAFQLCVFAACGPLVFLFASGFGNGLVSLVFLAAISYAIEDKDSLSLVSSGLLPLLRPDAIYLSIINPIVMIIARRLARKQPLLISRAKPLLLLPIVSTGIYYVFFRIAFGHWVPTPVRFKAFTLPMFSMFSGSTFVHDVLNYCLAPAHVIGFLLLLGCLLAWQRNPQAMGVRTLSLALYSLATFPVLVVYTVIHATIFDASFGTYSRYWISFELTFLLFTLSAIPESPRMLGLHQDNEAEATITSVPGVKLLIAFMCLSMPLAIALDSFTRPMGRIDGMFSGALVQRFLPNNLKISTSEMNTFGLMIERPVLDLWGYTTPAIASSSTCNGLRIRGNSQVFLAAKPDIYWPYFFTSGSNATGSGPVETLDAVPKALATFHELSKDGNLLGDMEQVLTEYDVIELKANGNQAVFLIRKQARDAFLKSLEEGGFVLSKKTPIDLSEFRRLYDSQTVKIYPCG